MERGRVKMDDPKHLVTVGGREVDLSPREYELLKSFLNSRGELFDRIHLALDAWGIENGEMDDRSVDQQVKRLREKIGAKRIKTIIGYGYKWLG